MKNNSKKVHTIVLSDPNRQVIVVSALGKRTSDDDKSNRLTLFDLCLPSASC